ncbi:LPXTG cell wall anchor domain-containing protein [Atopobium fossor]|uniref:LPXTG cell wall anchor domain-containing protein n=1 Tax=Atopobium fossor TaxID=39487 RepID=UPI0003F688D5|nr:LPXTG cell wall anchor domain-containing protein [Atopobium fossor]
MVHTKRFVSGLLAALLVLQLAFPAGVLAAEEQLVSVPTTTEQPQEGNAVAKQAQATDVVEGTDDKSNIAVEASTSVAVESASASADDRAVASVAQEGIEVSLVSTDGKTTYGTLANPKASVSLPKGRKFNLRIHAIFPSATNKSIEIALPYGMEWNTDFKFDKTAGWVGELQTDGVITPAKQTEASKQPVSVYNWSSAGTLTLNFQDTTQEVTFDLPMGLAFSVDTGLANIPNAITVTQNYTKVGNTPTASSLAADIAVTNRPGLTYIGFRGDYTNKLNKNGNIEVGLDSPIGTGHDVSWAAALQANSYEKLVLEDYFYAMLAPEKAEYLGRYSTFATSNTGFGLKEKDLKILNPGEKFTLSTGQEYTVPTGKKLYVWDRAQHHTIPVSGYEEEFSPMWRFPKEDFPVGSVAEISQIDVGVKYHNPYGVSSYLPYDANRLKTMKYEIVEPKEDVYVNTTMYGSGKDWPLWEGYIADNEVYMGAPGFEHTQERTLGYFTVGNRGTGDSRNKTVIIDYDVNNTKIAGVTSQTLPLISKEKADGTQPTKVSDFKVTLWNSKTGETSNYTLDASNIKQRFRVEDVLGKHIEGMYLKRIEYKINTIPAKTEFTAWSISDNGGERKEETNDFAFFGNVLTNDVRVKGQWGDDPSLFKTRIRIENTGAEEPNWHHRNQSEWDFGDGKGTINLKYPGRSADHVTIGDTFTAFTGKSFIQGHGQTTAYHDGTAYPLNYVIGDQIRNTYFNYFSPVWNGSTAGIQTHKAMYYISPLGDDLSFQMVYRSVGAKDFWRDNSVDENKVSPKQPDVYEVPVSDALKQKYPNAKVYKLDFSKFTSDQDTFDTRAFGPSVYWRESAQAIPYAINSAYWAYTGEPNVLVSFNSDPEKDVPGTYDQLMWYEYDIDTPEDLVYGSGMTKDIYDLNGNGSTEDMIGTAFGIWNVKAPTDLIVRSAAKMATQPDSQYITYDGLAKTLIGANSTVDYRLIANNPTQSDANGFTVYWPVPKKDENWGKAIQPNGAFQFDLFLNGGIKSQLPAGYTVSYAKNATPTSQALDWDGFNWTNEADTANWSQQDWDAVNFVRISSPKDSVFSAGAREEFKFNLTLRDVPKEDFEKQLINVYTPTYLRDLGSGKGYRYGQPVAIVPTPSILKGKVWVDADYDGKMDTSETEVVAGVKLELFDTRGKLVDTATTESDGTYSFKGLKNWSTDPSGKFDEYSIKAYNPTDPTANTLNTFVRFSPNADKKAQDKMVMTAAADQTTASVAGVTVADDNALALNVGLTRMTKVEVVKKWVEGKNADGTEGGTINHDPIQVELTEDGAAATNIDAKKVDPITLSANGWSGTFENLLYNNPATNAVAAYSVAESEVPEGYVAEYSYETKTDATASYKVATITNTRIHGTIKVSKVDKAQNDKFLPNTGFELRKDGVAVRQGVTDNTGVLTFEDVPYGEYEVVEITAPEGYVLDQTPYPVQITTQDQVVSLTVGDDEITSSILVTKVDAQDENKKLVGAEFELRKGDTVVAKATTGNDGTLTFADVTYGEYEVIETKAPEGYVLDQTPHPVKIVTQDEVISLTIGDNKIKSSVLVTKVDAQNEGKVLPGAEFELRQGDKVVAKASTGADGTVLFSDVAYGSYELVETKAPEGYELDQKPTAVTVTEDGAVIKLVVKNTPTPVVVVPKLSILPKTGDSAGSVASILFASATLTVFAWVLRKKRKQA